MYLMDADTTTAELGLFSATMTVGMEYQQTFCSDPALRAFAAPGSTISFQKIASCQSSILAELFWIEPELITTPARLQLLHNPAFEYAALLQVAGGCQVAHEQHMKEQHREARPRGSRGRGSSRGSSGTTSSSSSSRAGTVSSSSFAQLVVPPDHELVAAALGKEAVAAHAMSLKLKLEVSQLDPDLRSYLDQGTRALLEIWNVVVGSRMQSIGNGQSAAAGQAAEDVGAAAHVGGAPPLAPGSFAAAAAAVSAAPPASSARVRLTTTAAAAAAVPAAAAAAAAVAVSAATHASSARVRLTTTTTAAAAAAAPAAGEGVLSHALNLRLLLEALALAGALGEICGDVLGCLDLPVLLLYKAAAISSLEDRRVFITARGGFLLEVFGVLLKVVEQEQQREADHELSRDILNHVLYILDGCLHAEDPSQVCGFCKCSCQESNLPL